jgi:glycosyltransferase involved in cell wall biosynthesis
VVADKRAVMGIYQSQLAQHRYLEVVLGLNAARSYTLGADVTHAEGFYAYDAVIGDLAERVMASLAVNWRAHQQGAFSGPLVSVVIRTKDRPAMLREALRSLAAQNYSNLEALVVNDGGQQVEDLVKGFDGDLIDRVRYVDLQPGRGRSAAANAGLERAAGDYLLFLDDDDLLLSNHIATLVNTLESRRDIGVAYAGVRCLRQDEAGEWQEFLIYNDAFDPVRLLYENYIPIHAALFRRGLIDEGCRFDENLSVYEDWDFWVQLSRKTPFLFVNQISAVYRIGVYGSFGVVGDSRFATRSIEEFFDKWRGLWSLDEVLHIRGRFFELQTSTEHQLRDLTNQIHRLRDRSETRIRALDERIVAIYNSTSWRITAPIRFLRNTTLKIFNL